MKKIFTLALLFFVFTIGVYSQKISPSEPPALTPEQQAKLMGVKEARLDMSKASRSIPYYIDNSLKPYFRPLVAQVGLECGQASSIGLGLTYELNAKRLLPGNVAQNQQATHFTYNFLNGGVNNGVSFMESWEIVKRVGNPTVYDYGGIAYGGASRWMSGYNLYYNAMHNRITGVEVIYINTLEGLNTLRNWIYNHMGNDTIGGVANFYSQTVTVTQTLPAGTPFGGQYVITTFGSNPNHAMTILGYNDSIRFDFNGDGLYTNNIDINGDSKVDIHDWEIGAFKMANTYGNLSGWGNQGFAWAMYKAFAENPSSGGIWNNAVYISYVKQDLSPKMTMKITLKHTSRNKLKVMAGVAQNVSATEPEVVLDIPIMDYQGGDLFMKGGTAESDKTIEFGFDITPLLSEIANNQQAKFFLMVDEDDPTNLATGQIVSFDLVDYTSGTTTIPGGFSNVPLNENGLTTLSIITTPNCSKPAIQTTSLPDAKLYEPYSVQLNATGGSLPYKWYLAYDYNESQDVATFPATSTQLLTVNNTSSGYATQTLPFEFPFYGKKYTTIYPHVDGYLMFDNHPTPWPYIIYERTFLKKTKCIAPYMSKPLVLVSSEGDGIWYQGCADSATFRWRASIYGSTPSTDLNFAVTLYPDGRIRYYYGTMSGNSYTKWQTGLSSGDDLNHQFASINNTLAQPLPNSRFLFQSQQFPTEFSITESGLFSGIPEHPYNNLPVKFLVEDNNFLYDSKTLTLNTQGVEISYKVTSGNDSIIEYGENARLRVTLKNVGSATLHNLSLKLNINDNYITMNDSVETIGTLLPGQTLVFADALSFTVLNSIPDAHPVSLNATLTSTEDEFHRATTLLAYAAVPVITNTTISDGNNNILMPGETATLNVTVTNKGGSKASGLASVLSLLDPYLTIQQASSSADSLVAGASKIFSFTITASGSCPNGHIGLLDFNLIAAKDIALHDTVYVNIGAIVEDFETGNYLKYPWQLSGNTNWSIGQVLPFEGIYCSASGTITDNQESNMYITLNVLSASEISFYRKVSSEANYDFLYFYIDGIEKGRWAGEAGWARFTYQVSEGVHTFMWKYKKDYSISTGSDKAWVDYISWPPVSAMLLYANAGADDNACYGQSHQMQGQVINAASIYWTGSGDGTFTNSNSVNALYTPGASDLASGNVVLTIHAANGSLPAVTDDVLLSIYPAPVANAGPDAGVCSGNSYTISQSSVTGTVSTLWTTSGDGTFNNASLVHPVYTPGTQDLQAGSVTLTLTASGPGGCTDVQDAMLLSLFPFVITDAGEDQTIPYNTTAALLGDAEGGSGIFSAHWEPVAFVNNPDEFITSTIELLNNQLFTLTATNNTTGCSSSDQVLITVTGAPLSVVAESNPAAVCPGDSSQLNAMAYGGTGTYTYSWTSDPAGFTSSIQNPVVYPAAYTIYIVEANDGNTVVSGTTSVGIDNGPAAPSVPQGPEYVNVVHTTSTNYTTSGSSNTLNYSWLLNPLEAGSVTGNEAECTIFWNSAFNGIAELSVTGSNNCGISPVSDTLFIIANDHVDNSGTMVQAGLLIYPNPGTGIFHLILNDKGVFTLSVTNAEGQLVKKAKHDINNTNDKLLLDLSGLSEGMYYVVIKNEKHVYSGKVTVIR